MNPVKSISILQYLLDYFLDQTSMQFQGIGSRRFNFPLTKPDFQPGMNIDES